MTSLTDTQVINASGGLVDLGYVQRTTDVTSTATTVSAASNIFSSSLTFVSDGSPVMVEFFCPRWINSATSFGRVHLVDGSGTELGQFTLLAGSSQEDVSPKYRYTPAAGVQTLNVRLSSYDGTTVTLACGAGGSGALFPMFLRVSKIVQASQWPAVTTGTIICTSTTRPSSPFAGQKIYETDTSRYWTYSTWSQWVPDDMVFATEAARDTAIPNANATEGMRAYITSSTVAAATGTTTAVPTGIQTIYNGTSWVCVTPVGASSNTTGTTISGTYVTTLTGDGTAISATLSTGTTALVTLSANATSANAIGIRQTFSVSGATTVAAADNNGSTVSVPNAGNAIQLNRTLIITGLTAGTNTFTMNYQSVGASNTASFSQRSMFVQGIA